MVLEGNNPAVLVSFFPAPCHLVSDPWDDGLINSLLCRLSTPLTSYPSVTTWDCNLPSISPKMTTTMGEQYNSQPFSAVAHLNGIYSHSIKKQIDI